MKKDFNDFCLEDLYKAYYDCRKNKRNTKTALEFEYNLEENILSLYDDLMNWKYNIGKSLCFITTNPKPREIFAANFRDRIIHHLLYKKIESIFSLSFVYDSAASQKQKWILFARNRVYKHMQKSSKNFKSQVFYLQIDIKSFFMSIDKNILERLITKKLKKWFYRDLTLKVLWHNPTTNFLYKWDKKLYTKLKKSKSLFFVWKNKWLAIWNLTSQLFANIYLNELDNYIKRDLKCLYYSRCVDDMILLSSDKNKLKYMREKIKTFLKKELLLELQPSKIVMQDIRQWINYLWAIIKPYCIYTANRTYNNFLKVIFSINTTRIMTREEKNKKLSQLNSYMGFIKHSSYKKRFIKG